MLASIHLVTGAAIGKSVRPFWLAAVAAFASHFALDIIPHSDTHALFGAPGGVTRAEALATLVDVALGAALVLWTTRRRPWRRAAIWAAFLAVVVDLVDNVPPWGPHFQTWVGTAWFSAWHHGIQHNLPRSEWPLGIAIQLVVLAAGVLVLLRARPRP